MPPFDDPDVDRLWKKLDTSLNQISQVGLRLKVDFLKEVQTLVKDLKDKINVLELESASMEDVLKTVMGLDHVCKDGSPASRSACPVCIAANFFDAERQKPSS